MLLLDPQELEYLLEHLGHPETLKEKKFQEWLLDNDHRQLFERVRDYREAYLRVDKGEMINLAKEWEQFEIEKDFRGKHLHIVVKNRNHAQCGCIKMIVNGVETDGSYVAESMLTDHTEIEYIMS